MQGGDIRAGLAWYYSKSLAHLTTNDDSNVTPGSSRKSRSCCCCGASWLLRVEIIESYFGVNRKVVRKQLKLSELISFLGLGIFACFCWTFFFFYLNATETLQIVWLILRKTCLSLIIFVSTSKPVDKWKFLYAKGVYIRVGKIVCFPYEPLKFDWKHWWITF